MTVIYYYEKTSKLITNLRRTSLGVNFKAELVSTGETIYLHHKGMIDFYTLSSPPKKSHASVAWAMGKKSVAQKRYYVNKDGGPTHISRIYHVCNFEKIINRSEVLILVQEFLNGAEQAGYTDNIWFLNYEEWK